MEYFRVMTQIFAINGQFGCVLFNRLNKNGLFLFNSLNKMGGKVVRF